MYFFKQVNKFEGKTTDKDTWTEGEAAEESRFVMAWIVFPTYSLNVKISLPRFKNVAIINPFVFRPLMFASYNAQCCSLSQLFGWPTTQPALPFNNFNFKWKSKASKASIPSLLLSMPSNCHGLQSVHLHESSSSASVPVVIHRKRASTS